MIYVLTAFLNIGAVDIHFFESRKECMHFRDKMEAHYKIEFPNEKLILRCREYKEIK
jgi:hypothetical protein